MKRCSNCREFKNDSEFYQRSSDGNLRSRCKSCLSEKARQNHLTNPKKILLRKNRKKKEKNPIPWHIRNPEKRAEVIKRYNDTHKRELKEQMDILRFKFPKKWKARAMVGNAIKMGRLSKQPCEVCGTEKVEAHHKDYEKPLEVNWLCRKHHVEADKRRNSLCPS